MTLLAVSFGLAATLRLGVQPLIATDLPDGGFADPTAQFPLGGGLRVPLVWALRPGAEVGLTLTGLAGAGSDTVTWTVDDVVYESREHWAMDGVLMLSLGGAIEFLPTASWSPYMGAGLGGAMVITFHSFGGDTALLLDAKENDLDDPQNIDPYTLQAAPVAEVDGGVRFGRNVAVTVEAGYTVSFVSAAPLRKSPSALGARRSAYALDLVRLGVGVSVPL